MICDQIASFCPSGSCVAKTPITSVMRGLDPRIHRLREQAHGF
jgi:hypothetical protein